ncbi:hypothetical protein FKM82_023811 [Ascaphus truei]
MRTYRSAILLGIKNRILLLRKLKRVELRDQRVTLERNCIRFVKVPERPLPEVTSLDDRIGYTSNVEASRSSRTASLCYLCF